MVISSRTPEGQPNRCPLCGGAVTVEPSDPPGDAPCPNCGHLLWFTYVETTDALTLHLLGPQMRVPELNEFLARTSEAGARRLILDFESVPELSSESLSKLVLIKRKLGTLSASFEVVNVHPDLREVFRITRLDEVFGMSA